MMERMTRLATLLVSVLITFDQCDGVPQLIGNRGVFTLADGQVYRDRETVEASEIAAGLALRSYQDDQLISRHRKQDSRRSYNYPPVYSSLVPQVYGRPLQQNEIFDVLDSKFIDVFPENQFNKMLDEIEVERATSPTRSYPGEGLPEGIHPGPTRPPNRLVDLSRPIEPSIRTQNSLIGTIYDSPGYIPPPAPAPAVFSQHAVPAVPDQAPRPFVHLGGDGAQALGPASLSLAPSGQFEGNPAQSFTPVEAVPSIHTNLKPLGPVTQPLTSQFTNIPQVQSFSDPFSSPSLSSAPLSPSPSQSASPAAFVNLGDQAPSQVASSPLSLSPSTGPRVFGPVPGPSVPPSTGSGVLGPEFGSTSQHVPQPFVNIGPPSGANVFDSFSIN